MPDSSSLGSNLILGEVHTALLRSSVASASTVAERLVSLLAGERALRHERPIGHVRSPTLLDGVDCGLSCRSGAKPRGVGTVASHVAITGGHVVQGAAQITVIPGMARRRLAWSHYLARSGQVEIIGKANREDLAAGFLADTRSPRGIDLGGIASRLVDEVQGSPLIDHRPPFIASRTRLRWAALASGEASDRPIRFQIERDGGRTLVGRVAPADLDLVAEFSEDLALHDWLLTTLLYQLERSRLGIDRHDAAVMRLEPVVEHLLHLWMPAARLGDAGAALWSGLERRPGLERQWRSAVDRIRDQLALNTIAVLGGRRGGETPRRSGR